MQRNPMNDLERFIAVMEYQPVDRVPNWELGVWPQTRDRWEDEGLDMTQYHWDWFTGDERPGHGPARVHPLQLRVDPTLRGRDAGRG